MANKSSNAVFYGTALILALSIVFAYRSSRLLDEQSGPDPIEIRLQDPLPAFHLVDAQSQEVQLHYREPLNVLVFCRWEHLMVDSPSLKRWNQLASRCSSMGIQFAAMVVPLSRPPASIPSAHLFPAYEVVPLEQLPSAGVIGTPITALADSGGGVVDYWIGQFDASEFEAANEKLDQLRGGTSASNSQH